MALANQLPLPAIVQRGWSRHRRVSSAIEESDIYLFTFKYDMQRFFYEID